MGQNSQWTADLLRVQNDLYEILGINASSVLEQQIEAAIDAAEHGNSIGAIGNLTRLYLLNADLNQLKEKRPHAFKILRKDMIKSKDDRGGFHGARFEVHMAAQLSLRGLDFAKGESPDFTVEKITLECTSCRLIGGKTDPKVKLTQTIDAKASKPYANKGCLLAIDVTNLFFQTPPDGWQSLLDAFTSDSQTRANSSGFGAIGLFLFRQSENKIWQNGYGNNVVLGENASKDLADFVGAHFPQIGVSINGPMVSKEG